MLLTCDEHDDAIVIYEAYRLKQKCPVCSAIEDSNSEHDDKVKELEDKIDTLESKLEG